MRAFLFLAVLLVLTPGLAWAAEAAPVDAPAVSPATAPTEPVLEGGGCLLPDLAGLSDDEATEALEGAGFEFRPIEAATPACPSPFSCSSIANCAAGHLCAVADIGPCCTNASGPICCVSGTIKVRRCKCQCSGDPCNIVCPQSADVKISCS